ncbi:catalytic protein [Aspergillus sclerotiicarbonarius CBS 121057]|uniref:Carboxylic ester hydrolase n=1 Tax=Aspergillus sclerotiicarbonarius (strain CBS 121057 / IBT 28362) TaxID=1448318 RepID=A0A319EMP5_ASPSB|nr:catalytic protein [Aspergillus sclerotiicarbonarius CBS 121057]
MASPQVQHPGLQATFNGIERETESVKVHEFRGIKYASVPARFERAHPVLGFADTVVDASRYGYTLTHNTDSLDWADTDFVLCRLRCPQVDVDVRHLLRIPEDFTIEQEPEDEFECLNLDITCPPASSVKGPLPVFLWIYGGSQVVTFCSAASKICEIVADSIKTGQPIIFVLINYRLNIFSFGDGQERNLAVKDQKLGIEWVRKNISAFGGDPDNITLAGESAGAVYVHAHLITGTPVKRAVLASGSLYLSSPLPVERGQGLIKTLEAKVRELGQPSLRQSSVSALIQALEECNVNTMWLQEDEDFQDWEAKPELVDEVMIGDTEYESVIWRNGIEAFDGETIAAAFEQDEKWGTKLRKMYHVVADRPTACKLGALDLVHDTRYTLPVELVSEKLQAASKRVYKYVVDQANPWQPSSRAHHAVDLLFLFDGVDLSFNPAAKSVGQEMRKRWVQFVNGNSPWPEKQRFAYGPLGECGEISEAQFASRRRVEHVKALREAGMSVYMPILFALTAGKISLLN